MSALPPGLHVVATPIGNLGDLSPRAADTLRRADRILVEDTRVTAKLLAHIGAKVPMTATTIIAATPSASAIVARLGSEAIALVSDAGTPLISDPGYKLVRAARAAGHAVHTVPGPVRRDCRADARRACRPTASCSSASCRPRPRRARDAIAEVAGDPRRRWCLRKRAAPRRHACSAGRPAWRREAAVAREISKLHEECVDGHPRRACGALRRRRAQGRDRDRRRPAAAAQRRATRSSTPRSTKRSARLSPSRAAAEVAERLNVPRKRAYARALERAK